MPLHKTLHLARNTLTKSLAHGYAQSVVAATQTSYAANNNSFNLPRYHNKHHARQLHSVQPGTSQAGRDAHESGLAAYYTAWQKSQKTSENEWAQFQFQKLLGWKEPGLSPGLGLEGDQLEEFLTRPSVHRSKSANAVDGLRADLAQENDLDLLARFEEIVESDTPADALESSTATLVATAEADSALQRVDSGLDAEKTITSPVVTVDRGAALEAEIFAQELQGLVDAHQYAAIPVVFQSMLARNITPLPAAYDSLLSAAVQLTGNRADAVSKALDVYADIVSRQVQPSIRSYTILLDLMSKRAIEVAGNQVLSAERQLRFPTLYQSTTEASGSDVAMDKALQFFGQATDAYPQHVFGERTYSLLISACAEQAQYAALGQVYSHMKGNDLVPRADVFVSMIHAFAKGGDHSAVVNTYNQYKELAILNDAGSLKMVRKDDDVYAAVIRAYTIMQMPRCSAEFRHKLEATLDVASLEKLRNVIGLKALVPELLQQGYYSQAAALATEQLQGAASDVALAAVTIRAADRDQSEVAKTAYSSLSSYTDCTMPAVSLAAMYLRQGRLQAADACWASIDVAIAKESAVDLATAQALAGLQTHNTEQGLARARAVFEALTHEYAKQITGATRSIVQGAISRTTPLDAASFSHLVRLTADTLAEHNQVASDVLSLLQPDQSQALQTEDIQRLMQMQGKLILESSESTRADSHRFEHLSQIFLMSNAEISKHISQFIEAVANKLGLQSVIRQLQQRVYHAEQMKLQASLTPLMSRQSPAFTSRHVADAADPFSATTDVHGSTIIVELLESGRGNPANNLSTAFKRLQTMHHNGRHPRPFTYSKIISAAAKCNRLDIAHQVLAMARHDIPYTAGSPVAHHGWVSILDTMISACLTTGQRGLADGFHTELLAIGAAPSANTFGQYITTLKQSTTKPVDEATEAVTIFQRARSEGVEPTSFLYNVLIGKLGKARRIDDCLFYYREMRSLHIVPTSVTYGTIINALCRVSDQSLAEQLFAEMESMPNYKARPAPYHSIMQYFLTTKRDRSKVLQYYHRMRDLGIEHTPYTYKLLIDTYATLDPVDMPAAESVLDQMQANGFLPDALHYSALIHAKGCVQRDMSAAQALFDSVIANSSSRQSIQPCLFQALFESMLATDSITQLAPTYITLLDSLNVEFTPYIANALIQGYSAARDVAQAEVYFNSVPKAKREPSLYEAMTRAYLANGCVENAMGVVREAGSRGYPSAVMGRIGELLRGHVGGAGSVL